MRYPIIAMALGASVAPTALAQTFTQTADLYPAGLPGALLGQRVAANGSLVAAIGGNALYMFDLESGSSVHSQRFTAAASGTPSGLGNDLDMDGSTLAVAAEPNGSVAFFLHNGSSWSFDTDLVERPGGGGGDGYARDISLRGDWLAVGAPLDDTVALDSGAVYLYQNNGLDWVQSQILHDPSGAANLQFGTAVSLDGPYLAVGAPKAPAGGVGNAGHVVFYELDATSGVWADVATVISQAPRGSGNFGASLDLESTLNGTRVAIGEPGQRFTGATQGYIEIWDRQFGFWFSSARLNGVLPNEWLLGQRLNLRGDRLMASAVTSTPGNFGPVAGVGVVFALSAGGTWEFRKELVPSGNRREFSGGSGIAIAGERFLVGAQGRDFPVANTGTVHVFTEHDFMYESVGFGDLASNSCPCSNASQTRREEGCINSNGFGGHLVGTGSDSMSANDFELIARGVSPNQLALLFSGSALLTTQVSQGDGSRATGGQLLRLGFTAANSGGEFRMDNLMQTWGWPVGQTVVLQAWYRDPAGPCANGYNVTNAVQLTPQP